MLEKTFALLNDIPGGTYVPDEKKCYDDAEIEQLSQILKRLLWAPSQIRKKLQQSGVTIIPCNFWKTAEHCAFSLVCFIETLVCCKSSLAPDNGHRRAFFEGSQGHVRQGTLENLGAQRQDKASAGSDYIDQNGKRHIKTFKTL